MNARTPHTGMRLSIENETQGQIEKLSARTKARRRPFEEPG